MPRHRRRITILAFLIDPCGYLSVTNGKTLTSVPAFEHGQEWVAACVAQCSAMRRDLSVRVVACAYALHTDGLIRAVTRCASKGTCCMRLPQVQYCTAQTLEIAACDLLEREMRSRCRHLCQLC